MKAIKFLSILFVGILLFAACQKELSFESGFDRGPGTGSLSSGGGKCQPITVGGYYLQDSTLSDSNYVLVTVNVNKPGPYNIFTEFKNGFSFSDSGYFISTGSQSVKLKAKGKPIAIQQTLFTVAFDTSICSFAIDVRDTIILPSVFIFDTTRNCNSAVAQGIYKLGTPLNSSNKVDVKINVFKSGSYAVQTDTIGGMWFKASGIVYGTGSQTIIFQGYGTPTTLGIKTFPLKNGASVCKFTINVDTGTVVIPPSTSSDSAWSFNQTASKFFVGPVDTAFLTANPLGGSILTISGSSLATGDTTLNLVFSLTGNVVAPGSYKTNAGLLNVFDVSDATGTAIYSANFGTTASVMTMVITSFDNVTKIVKGTFSGNADASGTAVPITNGKFQAVVK